MLTRLFLAITALMFTAFGAWSISSPAEMVASMGVEIGGPAGLFEMRGVYGGISLGGALLCGLGYLHGRFREGALLFVATYMGGYVLGRLASLGAGDSALSTSWMFAGFEAVMFVLAVLLLRRAWR